MTTYDHGARAVRAPTDVLASFARIAGVGLVCLSLTGAAAVGTLAFSQTRVGGSGSSIADQVGAAGMATPVVTEEVAALPDDGRTPPLNRMTEDPEAAASLSGRPQRIADTAENMRLLVQLMSMIATCDYRCSMSPQ